MDANVQFDDTKFREQLFALNEVLRLQGGSSDGADLIFNESRLFLKSAIQQTPPKSKAKSTPNVEKSVASVFTAASEDFLLYEFGSGGKNIDQWFTSSKGVHTHAQFDYLDIHGNGMNDYFYKQRINGKNLKRERKKFVRGSWKAKYVVSEDALARFQKQVVGFLGMMKCGWLFSYKELGGACPRWINRHLPKRNLGNVINSLSTVGRPSITMTNSANGIEHNSGLMNRVFRARANALKTKINLLVTDYGRDIAGGRKILKKVRKDFADGFAE
jgi:hypothetical protein